MVSEAKLTVTSQEGASKSPSFDRFVVPPRKRGGCVKVGEIEMVYGLKLVSWFLRDFCYPSH